MSSLGEQDSWTVVVDLSKRFNTNTFEVMSQTRKDLNVPLVTRFSLWADSNQDSVLLQGGEFYGSDLWNRSSYYVTKPNLPSYTIWKFGLGDKKWTNVTSKVGIKANFVRAVGGAGVSAPRLNMSFYLGFVFGRCLKNMGIFLTDGIAESNHHAARALPRIWQ